MLHLIYITIFFALLFDFINGFHDASNSIATIVATKVLKPFTAVAWMAFFNFIAFLFFHLHVASTIGTGLVSPSGITPVVILAALLGAISFSLFTWYFGLPSSSSHALMGGLLGAAIAKSGFAVVKLNGLTQICIAIILSPLLGLLLAYFGMMILNYFLKYKRFSKVANRWAKRFQLVSASMLSLGHGGNDAQKTMGIIAVLLFTSNLLGPNFYVPWWVVISCNLVMALGTLAGGWRIVKTLGEKITKLEPLSGAVAETASAITLFSATHLGLPVSTTHTVTGAIAGVGFRKGWQDGSDWVILKRIGLAWVFTVPVAGIVAAMLFYIFTALGL